MKWVWLSGVCVVFLLLRPVPAAAGEKKKQPEQPTDGYYSPLIYRAPTLYKLGRWFHRHQPKGWHHEPRAEPIDLQPVPTPRRSEHHQ